MRMRVAVWSAVLLATLASCGKLRELPTSPGPGGSPDPSATFTRVQNEIFTPSCALFTCHDPAAHQSELTLAAPGSYANIVGVPSVELGSLKRVAPSDPDNSYVYRKVTGTNIAGSRMPLGRAQLSDAQLALLRDWIRRGAPHD